MNSNVFLVLRQTWWCICPSQSSSLRSPSDLVTPRRASTSTTRTSIRDPLMLTTTTVGGGGGGGGGCLPCCWAKRRCGREPGPGRGATTTTTTTSTRISEAPWIRCWRGESDMTHTSQTTKCTSEYTNTHLSIHTYINKNNVIRFFRNTIFYLPKI